MKLHFDKKEDGEIYAQVEGKDFSTKDYIQMIKEVKSEKKIEASFGKQITQDEQDSVKEMLVEINQINKEDTVSGDEAEKDDF
jgi:hypothetical protein